MKILTDVFAISGIKSHLFGLIILFLTLLLVLFMIAHSQVNGEETLTTHEECLTIEDYLITTMKLMDQKDAIKVLGKAELKKMRKYEALSKKNNGLITQALSQSEIDESLELFDKVLEFNNKAMKKRRRAEILDKEYKLVKEKLQALEKRASECSQENKNQVSKEPTKNKKIFMKKMYVS